MPEPESARLFLARQMERLRGLPRRKRIVFPEGDDGRVRAAAARLAADGLLDAVLLSGGAEAPAGVRVVNPAKGSDVARYATIYRARGGRSGLTDKRAAAIARQPLYFAALMGRPGTRTASGVFFMCVQDRRWGDDGVLAFADCAMVPEPGAAQVAEIAMATARSVRSVLGVEPRVALLSFSSKGSARHASAAKMTKALRILRERVPDLAVDGELQADAALVESVAALKAPGSAVAGRANTLIFPDLNSANRAYKLVERLGGAAAFGPLLQGLAKPVSDLSRGCSAQDIYGTATVTALQSEV